MSGTKISAAADAGTLLTTDVLPVARSGSTTAYHATMAEVASYANGAYAPNYYTGTPAMDGTGASGTAAFVSRGDHVHPSDISRAPLASPTFTGVPAAPTPTTGTNTTQLATTAFVQSQMVASGAGVSTWNTRAGAVVLQQADIVAVGALHDVGRNLLHNPLFNVAQRGAGPWTTPSATLDRWVHTVVSDAIQVSQSALADTARTAIGDEQAAFAYMNVFTGNAAAAAQNYAEQRIENVRRLAGKTVTLSFWAAALAGTPKLGINFVQIFGTGGSPSTGLFVNATGQSVSPTSTWARYSVTTAFPTISGKTLGTNGDSYSSVVLYFSSGATNNAFAGNIGVQSGTVGLWGVQLEVGSVATPLEKPDPQQDLAKCQRFYQTGQFWYGGYGGAGAGTYASYPFAVSMRAPPTVTPTFTAQTNCSGSAAINISGGQFTPYTVATVVGGYVFTGTFTASADL